MTLGLVEHQLQAQHRHVVPHLRLAMDEPVPDRGIVLAVHPHP